MRDGRIVLHGPCNGERLRVDLCQQPHERSARHLTLAFGVGLDATIGSVAAPGLSDFLPCVYRCDLGSLRQFKGNAAFMLEWLHDNRAKLEKNGMPSPLPGDRPLVWDRAQIYAWKDRNLRRELRIAAMAYRAAEEAARNSTMTDDVEAADRARLDAIFANGANAR